MSRYPPRDPAASVSYRLKEFAKSHQEDAQQVLIRYANERFLYRLSQSMLKDCFVLKGAFLFTIWAGAPHRPTQDIDLLRLNTTDAGLLIENIVTICSTPVGEDGLVFILNPLLHNISGRRNHTKGNVSN